MTSPFLEGKIIYLRRPDLQIDIIDGNWHQWFNSLETTKYLTHGIFPVTQEEELNIIKADISSSKNLILAIAEEENKSAIGVISLKNIDYINRRAEIVIVLGKRAKKGAALEAMALLTQHAFDRLNLEKLYAGQHEGLWKWVNTLELIGYQIEGYRKNFGRRDCYHYGIILTGITSERFKHLRELRSGNILGNDIEILLKQRSKVNKIPQLAEYLESLYPSPTD